jgi:hypothetical protein
VDESSVSSHSVRIEWFLTDISGNKHLEYRPAYSIAGENHWISHDWTKIQDMSYTFDGLFPFTR